MKHRVLILPEAEADLADAFSWYEDRREGLGHDFLLQVEAGLKFIERSPEANAVGYKGTRRHLLKRFPYKIIYIVEREAVTVLALLHGRRSPELVKKRLNAV